MYSNRGHRDPAPGMGLLIAVNAPDSEENQRGPQLPHRGCPAHSRNMFSTDPQSITPDKRFAGLGDLERTVQEMAPLARAMCRPGVREGSVPAGYTYLAQLVAHDMAVIRGGTKDGDFNYQSKSPEEEFLRPLTLGSLYGPEHAADGHAWLREGARAGAVRLHRFRQNLPENAAVPAYDLARDEGGKAVVYDDSRNDDTPILAQTCALFFAFHNHCAARLRERFDNDDLFHVCRQLTIETYQRIIRNDLLRTLLHPDVWRHYEAEGVLIDRGATLSTLPAVELMHGAFRFGHSMVRSWYRLNRQAQPISLPDLLAGLGNLSELRAYDPGFWKVDWTLFYGEVAQTAGPLAPSFAPIFAEAPDRRIRIDAEKYGEWRDDLAMRDLARSVDSGLSSVPGLAEHLRPFFPEGEALAGCVSFDDVRREAAIRAWCENAFSDGVPPALEGFLITDPPLSFYTLFEASLPVEEGGGARPEAGARFGAGRHLGTMGSILLAEAVHAAFRASGGPFGTDSRLPRARRIVHGDEAGPSTMQELFALLATSN